MGLKTGIWASRLEFWPRDWDLRGETYEKEKEEKEKIPHTCESIGNRTLRGRCPKGKRKKDEVDRVRIKRKEEGKRGRQCEDGGESTEDGSCQIIWLKLPAC